jgi:hypothetical protein
MTTRKQNRGNKDNKYKTKNKNDNNKKRRTLVGKGMINKKTRKMVPLKCSPKKGKKLEFSCFDEPTIYKLKELWNLRHLDTKIETNDVKDIWTQLKTNLAGICNKESCWLKQQFANGKLDKELKESFAPESPDEWKKNPNEWLNSMDILAVMKQYEKAYDCFDFIGPSPIDFDARQHYGECVWQELCEFSVEKQIKMGKTKIGMIFNLDPHTKGGSHWVSMFVNIKKKKISFFDSVGDPVPKQVMELVKRIQKQGSLLRTPIIFEFDQNHPVEHQYGDTECGIYSLYFIVHLLEDKHTSQYFKKHILSDKYMEKFRKVYFNEDL